MNEQDMIQGCQEGDHEAFRHLVEAFQDRVYTLALSFCNNPMQAQDITQDVFLKLYRTLGKFRAESSFTTWLHRIVVNTCLNEQRRKRRWVDLPEAPQEPIWEGDNPDDDLCRREVVQVVRRAIDSMPDELRMSLLLRYLEGRSYAEIATAMDCSIGTVSSRLNRAHRALGQQLWEYRSLLK